jgi:hypothetical protein
LKKFFVPGSSFVVGSGRESEKRKEEPLLLALDCVLELEDGKVEFD